MSPARFLHSFSADCTQAVTPTRIAPRLLLPIEDPRGELVESLSQRGILFHATLHDLGGVNDRRMIAATEAISNDREGCVGVMPAKVHGNLSGMGEVARAILREQIGSLDVEIVTDRFLDRLDRNSSFPAVLDERFQNSPRELEIDG